MKLKRWSWALLLAVSCRPASTGLVPPAADPCRVLQDSPVSYDTISIAFSERENESGRLFLRLSGETLIGADCEGRIHPRLARKWTRESSGTVWSFELESFATAPSLVEQWELRRNGGIWPWARILEVRVMAPTRVEVRLDTAFAEVPVEFALPGLSVSLSPPADSGPVASVLVHSPTVDQRDLIDLAGRGERGVDLLITRDPAVISYARGKSDFSVIPLPWDRTYVTVAPVTRPDPGPGSEAELRESLARDVVRAKSRAALGPFWWESTSCRGTMPLLPMGRLPQVVYLRDDQTAREIAERLVAIQRSRMRATGLPLDAFNASLAGGEAAMYVLSLPRIAPGSCSARPAWPSASSVVPLVDVQAHALVRSGVPSFTMEADGTIRFDRALPLVSLPSSPR